MKRGALLLFIFIFSIVLLLNVNGATLNSCSIKSSCGAGEITLASVAAPQDAHISKDITKFLFKLCCSGTAISNSCDVVATSRDSLADLYLLDDSHVDPGPQANSICLSTTDNSNVDCRISGATCNSNEACVLSLYQGTDSHVADCSVNLPNKICCFTTVTKTCYVHGEARSDTDSLQCCVADTSGNELYYSKEIGTDLTGGCCQKLYESWDSFRGVCWPTDVTPCAAQCSYDPSQSQYFSTQGCFLDSPQPLPYELSCCQATQFGVTDKFQTEIELVRNSNNECTGAKFCSTVTKLCSSTPDGFCPQNYGDWSTCPLNEIGGGCNVCDPDCGTCGSVRFLDFPVNSSQNRDLTIKVEYTSPVSQPITLWRVNSGSDSYINTQRCTVQGSTCVAIFSPSTTNPALRNLLTSPSTPGASYTFKTHLSVNPDIVVQKTGYTTPRVEILTPTTKSNLRSSVSVQARAQSDSSISSISWYITKRDNPGTPATFSPVNVRYNQGACTFCNAQDCNLLGRVTYPSSTTNLNVLVAKDFDTLRCDNNDFIITVIAEDFQGNRAQDSVSINTLNPNAPCTDNCPVFDSRVLKIIIARVKTWV